MPKFNVDDYVMVEDRIKKFREKHPDGQIKTELVASTPDLQSVIVKAEVYDKEGNMLGSDLAQDHQGTHNFANEYSWVEVATTSAIGRALFNAGFQKSNGEKKASREEMQKVVNKQEQSKKEVAKITNKSAEKFAEDIGAKKKSVGDQLNDILKEMIPNDKKMKEVKTKIYNDMVSSTEVSEDVDNWTNKDMDKFLNRVEVFLEDEDIIDVVIGAEVIKECPSCKQTGNVEDNREKKSDPKFSKIPDFACSNYGENNGCGKGWWIGNDDLPTEWI
jgi:predicted outer membrane protein